MHQKLIVKTLLLTGLLASLLACSKNEPAVNQTPVITYDGVSIFTLDASSTKAKRDSVIVYIGFRDSDGDMGEDPRDTTRLKQVFGNQSWGNYEIRTFQFVNRKFVEITTTANAKHVVDLGKSTVLPQTGSLTYRQQFVYDGTYKLLPVKFQIRMRDRSLHESNVVETDTISIPIQ